MKVYLAGPIDGCTDEEAQNWRTLCKKRLGEDRCLDPMRRDYRDHVHDSVKAIVEEDIQDIDDCDVVLANCWKAGWGTPMEIMYSWMTMKPVVAVAPEGTSISPWLTYHAENVYIHLEDALTDIEAGVYG